MTSPTDSQTPESQDATELYELLDVLTGPPGWMADLEKLIADYTLATQEALLAAVDEVIDNYFKQFGAGTPLKITRELAALERQQLGKDGHA